MKKNYLLGMALIASLSFYSCDKEVVYVQDGNGVESVADGAQIITLQVENGGDGLATRAGRPLYSAEAKQTIENVKLWICDNDGKVVYVKEISVDSARQLKRIRTAPQGRAHRIRKRSNHVTLVLGTKEDKQKVQD